MKRKDQTGRNTVVRLKYYSGAFKLLDRGYHNLNIHGKITVRAVFCGNEKPSFILNQYINR